MEAAARVAAMTEAATWAASKEVMAKEAAARAAEAMEAAARGAMKEAVAEEAVARGLRRWRRRRGRR